MSGAGTPASGPGSDVSPISKGNPSTLVSPALNYTFPSCYVVNTNGTISVNSTLFPPGVPRTGLSLKNASLPSAWFGQTNATNATAVMFNSTVFCVQLLAKRADTPPRASRHALNTSETKLTKTSTTSSPHQIPSNSRTSSRPAVVNPKPPLPPTSVPPHTTTRPSEASPTTSKAPKLPNIATSGKPAVPSSVPVIVSKGPSPVAQSSPASVTKLPTGLGTRSTITTTVTETPLSTFSRPVSITETTDGHVTITAPPLITTTGLSTLPDGKVVTVTRVIANPPNQYVSSSSNGHSFFRNHAAAVGFFLGCAFALIGLVLLAFCCFRRRKRRSQRRGNRLPEISSPRPSQASFAGVTGNPAMYEQAGPNVHWRGFMHPRGPPSISQSLFSVPVNRSDDSLPLAHSAPVPPPLALRASSRSSYRVPVPYAGVLNDTRVENRRPPGAPSEQPQSQIARPSNAPPRLPMRSPLRLLAAQNISKIPRENALNLSLSRASSPSSVYPPSPRLSDADVDPDSHHQEKEVVASSPSSSSLNRESSGWLTRRLSGRAKSDHGHKVDRVEGNAESQGAQISLMDSHGNHSLTALSASSSSYADYSLLESPASETGTAFTSIRHGSAHIRKVAMPRTPPAALLKHRKSGARVGQPF